MTQPLRIAVLSAWHVHAEEYGQAVIDHPEAELMALWDDDRAWGEALADRLRVEFFADLDELLAREDLDGVTVTTATADHDEIIGRALAAGKHVFTEKLLSPTVAGCDALTAQAREAGLILTVSLPRLAHGYTLALREVLDSGALGQLTYSRVRLAHDGSTADWLPARFYDPVAALGGAFSDLAAHPVYLTQLILGTELSAPRATYTDLTGRGVEDNAAVTVSTPDGAIGVIESGFVSPASPFSIEVHGTAGSLVHGIGGEGMRIDTGEGWRELPIPADAPAPVAQWIEAIRSGRPTTENLERARALTALVVAANEDARPA